MTTRTSTMTRSFVSCLVVSAAMLTIVAAQQPTTYWRNQFHFSTPMNWINDPNGLVYDPIHKEYHMFSQYNPYGNEWGSMSWAHAISTDLLTWTHLPVAILTSSTVAIFSGSAVIDYHNTTQLCKGDGPCLVCVWAGNSANLQTINVAYSNNSDFTTYEKYAQNPVITIGSANFRDPAAFWYNPTDGSAGYWVVVIAHSDVATIMMYRSPDLLHWTLMSTFKSDSVGGTWECPDFFSLEVDGGKETLWVLTVSVSGSTGRYWVGNFNGTDFIALTSQPSFPLQYGPDFYASIVYKSDPENRRIIVAWMVTTNYAANTPTYPWRGQYTIPRVLSLSAYQTGKTILYNLNQNPVEELSKYRQTDYKLPKPVTVSSNDTNQDIIAAYLKFPGADVLELETTVKLLMPSEFGVYLRTNDSLTEYIAIGVNATTKLDDPTVYVDRRHSGVVGFDNAFPAVFYAPLPQYTQEQQTAIHIRIILDRSAVEVFIQHGAQSMSVLVFPTPNVANLQAKFWVKTGSVQVQEMDIWDFKSSSNELQME